MSPTRAGVLVGLFALLLAVYFGLDWRSRRVAEREASARRLFDVAADSVTGVRLERPGEAPIVLAKSADGRWRIVEPRPIRVDQDVVGRLVRSVAEVARERMLEGADPGAAQYGLAPPAATVTLETPSGPRRLALGASSPVGSTAYARRGDDPALLLVPATVRADATQRLFDLREKRIVDAGRRQAVRIEIRPARGAGEPILLVSAGSDPTQVPPWRLEGAPAGREVDQYRARRLVDAVLGMRMKEVLSEDRSAAGKQGLTPPARTVAVGLAPDAAPAKGEAPPPAAPGPTIEIGATIDQKGTAVAVKGEPAVYLVDTGSIAPLAWKPEQLLAPPPAPSPSPAASPSPSPAAAAR